LRFDNVPSGWSGSSTERFSGWDIIPTQVPYATQTLTGDSGLGCFYVPCCYYSEIRNQLF
jgi:hypothetical protein